MRHNLSLLIFSLLFLSSLPSSFFMATSPDYPPEFRAPPSSPVTSASGKKSAAVNDEELTNFLEHSLHVPNLVLPDRFFPREEGHPPEIDFQSLVSSEKASIAKLLESIAGIGCFQVVNHGISGELIDSVTTAGKSLFRLQPEKKMLVSRSPEIPYGFDEFSGEETEVGEEFFWCRDEGRCVGAALRRVWPDGYQIFSQKMEMLSTEVEKAAGKVLHILRQNTCKTMPTEMKSEEGQSELVVCMCNHGRKVSGDGSVNSLNSDVIRILIGKSDFSHAFCLHFCDGLSEFHVYSKKGWVSFLPTPQAIMFTVGDQIQGLSGGLYKHVIGRPIFNMEEECISMAFFYSPRNSITTSCQEKTISLSQQITIAFCLTLFYHLSLYIYRMLQNAS